MCIAGFGTSDVLNHSCRNPLTLHDALLEYLVRSVGTLGQNKSRGTDNLTYTQVIGLPCPGSGDDRLRCPAPGAWVSIADSPAGCLGKRPRERAVVARAMSCRGCSRPVWLPSPRSPLCWLSTYSVRTCTASTPGQLVAHPPGTLGLSYLPVSLIHL